MVSDARKVWGQIKTAAARHEGSLSDGLVKMALQYWHSQGGQGLPRPLREAFAASVSGAAVVDLMIDKHAADGTYGVLEAEFLRDLNAEAALQDLQTFYKTAGLPPAVETAIQHLHPDKETARMLGGAAIGGVIGGGMGAGSSDPDHPGSGLIRGALPGAVLGAAGGLAYNAHLRESQRGILGRLKDHIVGKSAAEKTAFSTTPHLSHGALLGVLAGGGIGALSNEGDPEKGAIRGAVPGALLGLAGGAAAGAAHRAARQRAHTAIGLAGLAGLLAGRVRLKSASTKIANSALSGTLGGALAGGIGGGLFGAYADDENPTRGAMRFALPGATLGSLAGFGIGKVKADQLAQAAEAAKMHRAEKIKGFSDYLNLLNHTTDTIKKQHGNYEDVKNWLRPHPATPLVEGVDFHRTEPWSPADILREAVEGTGHGPSVRERARAEWQEHRDAGPPPERHTGHSMGGRPIPNAAYPSVTPPRPSAEDLVRMEAEAQRARLEAQQGQENIAKYRAREAKAKKPPEA